MRVPLIRHENAFQCPISGRKFPFETKREMRVALREQQQHTSDLIVELDGDGDGIRRPVQHYINLYNRRHGPRTHTAEPLVCVFVPAA